ncbi:DUF6641 family protein [Limnohabitans sp. Rim28]|uniref:DUF6641 family protein n=1 Tax=Limnohabitans sp. Rim28 TaxID=1100720 RepID=UPI003516C52B
MHLSTHRRNHMSQALASLKLVNAKRQKTVDPIQFRRSKLNEKLKIQIEMAKALSRGDSFTVKRMKKVTDEVSGQASLIEVAKRTKTWWFTNNDTKRVAVQLFYGNKVIDLAKGKNAVEVSNGDELIAVLLKLQEAVVEGALDGQIEVAAESVKARFAK